MKPLLKNVLLAAATGLLFCMACPVLAQPKPTEPDPQVKPAAHEALQETLLRVVRHARRFESEELFWSWFTVLA